MDIAPVSSMSGHGESCLGPVSGDMNQGIINSIGNSSGLSVGASSLVTDANSALSCGPQLQQSASINNESHIRLPASPMSFSSNNISGSSMMDGSSIVQQSPHQERMQKQGASTATSQITTPESSNSLNSQKKPRLDTRQDDILQQQVLQQLLQRQDAMHPPTRQNIQLQIMLQQQRLQSQRQQLQQHQQQLMQSLAHIPRAPVTLQQQQQLREQLHHQAVQFGTPVKRPLDNGICSRRLMQYLYHQRQRPQEDSISYWRKFVAEYYAPQAKERLCLSMYDNISSHTLGIFPQSSADSWHCDICGSRSGKGYEATVEILPRLCQIKFERGVMDENLFLDLPREFRLPSGLMVLQYAKAVQESIYEHVRIVRQGQLQITFTQDLKILSWEFCARCHEEFLSRRALAPQVNQMCQVAQKYQSTVNDNGANGVQHQDLQAFCNMFLTAGRQLAKCFDSHSLNDLGFSKRYIRCLQISEVVNSMNDLIDFNHNHKTGPIESLKNIASLASAKLQKQESEHMLTAHGSHAEPNSLTKVGGVHPGLGSSMNNNLEASHIFNGQQQNPFVLNNYSSQHVLHHEASNIFAFPKQPQPSQFQGSVSSILTNPSVSSLSQIQQRPPLTGCAPQNNDLDSSKVNQRMHQQLAVQLMLKAMNSNRVGANGNLTAGDSMACGINGAPIKTEYGSAVKPEIESQNGPSSVSNNVMGAVPSRSNNSKSGASNPAVGANSFNSRPDLLQNMDLPELERLAQEFEDGGVFDGQGW